MADQPHPDALELLPEATARLIRNVDALPDEDLAGPSLLPGWSRAHVVAHLALNGEGLARVLQGVVRDRGATMYDSPQARDEDIEALSSASAAELRDRLMAATTVFDEAVSLVDDDKWAGEFERTPGGQVLPSSAIPLMRWREVEIHHADLACGYTAADWPEPFVVALLGSMRHRDWPTPFRVVPVDLPGEWFYGASPADALRTVSGPAADLAWWLTGRPAPDTLMTDQDDLPEVPPW